MLATPATVRAERKGNSQERTGSQEAGKLPIDWYSSAKKARPCATPCRNNTAVTRILMVCSDIFLPDNLSTG